MWYVSPPPAAPFGAVSLALRIATLNPSLLRDEDRDTAVSRSNGGLTCTPPLTACAVPLPLSAALTASGVEPVMKSWLCPAVVFARAGTDVTARVTTEIWTGK